MSSCWAGFGGCMVLWCIVPEQASIISIEDQRLTQSCNTNRPKGYCIQCWHPSRAGHATWESLIWCPIVSRSEFITHDLQPEHEFAQNASSCSLEHSDPMRAAICCDWCLDEMWSRVRDIHSSSAEFWLNSIEQLWTILNIFNRGKKILKFSGIGHLRSWNHVSAWNVCCSAVCKLADSDVQKNAIIVLSESWPIQKLKRDLQRFKLALIFTGHIQRLNHWNANGKHSAVEHEEIPSHSSVSLRAYDCHLCIFYDCDLFGSVWTIQMFSICLKSLWSCKGHLTNLTFTAPEPKKSFFIWQMPALAGNAHKVSAMSGGMSRV